MKILLDTCVFLWITSDPPQLSRRAQALFLDKEQSLCLSVISVAEMILKWRKGQLLFRSDPHVFIPHHCRLRGIELLNFDAPSALKLATLSLHHKDPFDHMIICQALTHNLTILTPDEHFRKYKVKVAW